MFVNTYANYFIYHIPILMLISKNNRKKHGFTLVEVLFVCSIFAIIVVWIIWAVNRSYRFMDNIKLQIKATNLAREWVEMMFNIRDTNWREHSWEKDKQWLCLWKQWNNNNDYCNGYFTKWIYYLDEKETPKNCQNNCNMHIYASSLWIDSNKENEFYDNEWFWSTTHDTKRPNSKIKFQWTYYYYFTENGQEGEIKQWNMNELLWSETDFYRIVRVYGIYCKNSSDVNDTSCLSDSSAPKEMRFCVKVFYKNNWDPHSTELCSIMTNFEE